MNGVGKQVPDPSDPSKTAFYDHPDPVFDSK